MTRKKYWMVLSGSLLSLLLLVLVFSRLDWKAFQESFSKLHLSILGVSALLILLSVAVRGLRWYLITGLKFKQFKYVWQATNIGYLGNMIYPVRAGEVLRIITLQHLTGLRFGNVLSSSVIDRILDVIMLGFSSLLVLWLHRGNLDAMLVEKMEYSILGVSSLAISSLLLTVIYVESLHVWVEQGAFWKRFPRLQEWLIHGLDGVRVFRRSPHPSSAARDSHWRFYCGTTTRRARHGGDFWLAGRSGPGCKRRSMAAGWSDRGRRSPSSSPPPSSRRPSWRCGPRHGASSRRSVCSC